MKTAASRREDPSAPGGTGRDEIIQRPALGDEIYQRLLDDMLSLRSPPGERLSVDQLAKRFGVSQTPTRAALIRLEAEGLVVKKHLVGFSVAPVPTVDQLENIFEMRSLTEPRGAARAARRASPEAVGDMRAVAEEMLRQYQAGLEGNQARLVLLDRRFHCLIADNCGNEILGDALSRLLTHMHIFRLRLQSDVAREVIEEHLEILAAIERGDAAAAETAMRGHIDAARDRIEQFVRRTA